MNSETTSTINYKGNTPIEINASNTSLLPLTAGLYTIKIGDTEHQQKFSLGGVYTVLAIPFNETNFVSFAHTTTHFKSPSEYFSCRSCSPS